MKNTNTLADIIYATIIIFCLCLLVSTCAGQSKVQNFALNTRTGQWQPIGGTYMSPDTLTTMHRYKWKGGHIIAMQDYKKKDGKWVKYGTEYAAPDTLRFVHAFVKMKL